MNNSGILLINKPVGMSSFFVVKKVRQAFGVKKVGHAGTLDPLACGLMIIALGKYTKLCEYLSAKDKIYETTFCLGTKTSTDDAEGEIIEQKNFSHITLTDLQKAIESFRGKIAQVPPNFSAIKVNGKRAYSLARNNEEISLKARNIEVFSIELTKFELPFISLKIHCSKGTYIRSIARDLGEMLGVGAYASFIKRTACSNFNLDQSVELEDLLCSDPHKYFLPNLQITKSFKTLELSLEEKDKIINNQVCNFKNNQTNEPIALLHGESFIAMLKNSDNKAKVIKFV